MPPDPLPSHLSPGLVHPEEEPLSAVTLSMKKGKLTLFLEERGWVRVYPAAWRAPGGKIYVMDPEDVDSRRCVEEFLRGLGALPSPPPAPI